MMMDMENGGFMRQKARIAAVTAGLVVAGGIFGTIAGALVLLVWFTAQDPSGMTLSAVKGILLFSIFVGGGLGAVLGPLLAWTVMRHVPLWLAVGGTTVGTFVSGGLTILITGSPGFGIMMGVVGCIASAIALHERFAPAEQRVMKRASIAPR